ncbi:BET1-like protein [Argiope bruennichi]|uniref:BET1-like protein n=1 Tax=Araneus ventricosus TaxID=182803 RepID=A0A4Y2LKY9_ARAVE|nr:BET1-like protein [Argiope bruennichi]GBN15445.1 BET1-like protein [Araneus ventricosus]
MNSSRQLGEDALEAQNRYRADELAKKISKLKSVAYDIEVEAKDHNRLLDDVDNEFDSSTGFLSGSLNKVNKMMFTGRSDRRLMCYVVLITVGLFIVFYYLANKVTR